MPAGARIDVASVDVAGMRELAPELVWMADVVVGKASIADPPRTVSS